MIQTKPLRSAAILGICLTLSVMMTSCRSSHPHFTSAQRRAADSIVNGVRGADSLALLQEEMEKEGDWLGSIVALRRQGEVLRNQSRFEEAIDVHTKGIMQAEEIRDTLEWIKALNNTGTDYRRIGLLDVAIDYHYRAWMIGGEFSDTSYTAIKNNLISLNGLGNIYLTMGDQQEAENFFRRALEGEKRLGSALGQAINYANIGSLFENRGELDSAWSYYRLSMRYNLEAGSRLGESLCHTYFGSLYEKQHSWREALREYETAYQILEESSDKWHFLNTVIALAGIYEATGNQAKTLEYLEEARRIAGEINSLEHISQINTLYYRHYRRHGDPRMALFYHEQAISIKDSLLGTEALNRIQSTRLNIEKSRQQKEVMDVKMMLQRERTMRLRILLIAVILAVMVALLLYLHRVRANAAKALRQLSLVRDNLFTNITHELRSPLTLIHGLSHEMQKESYPADVREKAQTIQREGNELLALVNQILDITKIKSSLFVPEWKNGNITAHISMIVDAYRDFAAERNITLQFLAREEVEMDFIPDYINKVIRNLLSNALKFTPEYGRVDVSAWRNGEKLLVDVTDTGEGMDEGALTNAFELFFQASNQSGHIGTGVGLALVKQIMDSIGGEISAESRSGKGTCFHLTLPISNNVTDRFIPPASVGQERLVPEDGTHPEESEPDNYQYRMLVIEDNRNIASYIGSLFGGYALSYASNGAEGFEKAMQIVPDIIITDLMMPGVDGLELCRRIRRNDIVNHIPIIVVTAKTAEEERIRAIEAGADACLAKPFNSDELRTLVAKQLERHGMLRRKFSENSASDPSSDSQLTDAERIFLTKTVDHIYILMEKGELDVSALAGHLCMSSRQFHRKITAITGETPASYILRIRMQRARQLLESRPGMTIEEIAERCGFEHTSSFYHAFKKLYGITPSSFRKGISG